MNNKIAKFISYLLPNRVVLWVIVRAFAYTSVHSYPDKEADKIGYSLLYKSWEYKTKNKLNDRKDNGDIPLNRSW